MKKLAHNGCLLLSKCWLHFLEAILGLAYGRQWFHQLLSCYFHPTGREMGRLSNDSDISTHHRDGSEKFHTRGCLWQGLQDKTQQGAGEKLNHILYYLKVTIWTLPPCFMWNSATGWPICGLLFACRTRRVNCHKQELMGHTHMDTNGIWNEYWNLHSSAC